MKTLDLGRVAAAVLCVALLASCASGSREAVQAPLGWGGPIEADELRRWPKERLEEAARWGLAEAPAFVVVPDSIWIAGGQGLQRQILEGEVSSNGKVVLLCSDGGGPESILLRIFDPASGEEAKIPHPKREDGQPLQWVHYSMAVQGDEIVLVVVRDSREGEGSDVLFANQEGRLTRPPAYVNAKGKMLGAFPDGSLAIRVGRTGMTDTTLIYSLLSLRPTPAGNGSSGADAGKVIFTTARERDTTQGYPTHIFGAHVPLNVAAVSRDTIWIVPTERPELVAVDRSGAVLLRVEWEDGDRTIPAEVGIVRKGRLTTWGLVEEGVVRPRTERFPAARRLLIGTNGLIHVQRMVWDDDRPRAGPEWLVFNQAGELAARLDIPRNLDVLAFGPAFVVAQGKNEAGVVEVRVYGLEKPPGG